MAKFDGGKEEWSSVQHALAYLNVADNLPHRTEGESVLLDHVSRDASSGRPWYRRWTITKTLKDR
jgi:hypothetical protein